MQYLYKGIQYQWDHILQSVSFKVYFDIDFLSKQDFAWVSLCHNLNPVL